MERRKKRGLIRAFSLVEFVFALSASCDQWRPCFLFCLASLSIPMMRQLLDVMNQTEQLPLCIHLALPP